MESKYRPQLDGIRAFAVLSVLIAHFIPPDYLVNRLFHIGRAGVVVFFVLSGYLITGILLRYRDRSEGQPQTQWRSVGIFYSRRMLRIFPIYYLTIFIATLFGYEPVRNYLFWHLTYSSNWKYALQGFNFGDASHLWSLCVEEQFYLLWPLAVIFVPPRFIRKLAVSLVVTGILCKFIGAGMGFNWQATNFTLMGCLDSLGLGALVAINQHQSGENTINRLASWSVWAGPVVLILLQVIRATVSFDIREEPFYQGLIDAAIAVSFILILVAAIHDAPGKLAAVLTWRPLRYIGKISYGIYLYHLFLRSVLPWLASQVGLSMPRTGLGQFLLYSSAAIAVASLSWHLIEKPVNNLKRHFVLQTAPSLSRPGEVPA